MTTIKCNEGIKPINEVGFIFACPGSDEKNANELVAGNTGKNLNHLLDFLTKERPDIFFSENRYDYLITNSVETVYFAAQDNGKTVPKDDEVLDPANVSRIIEEVKECKYIILFGKQASLLETEIKKNYQNINVLKTIHLSNKTVNSNKMTILTEDQVKSKTSFECKLLRLRKVAEDILKQL
jgi:hypothetical protein